MSTLTRQGRLLTIIFLLLAFLLPATLAAYDFGLILNQTLGYGNSSGDADVDYEAAIVPRFSALLGDSGELHISASVKVAYENNGWNFVPELLRSEFLWNFGHSDLSLGRMMFADPMNIAALGLFDGARFSHHTAVGTFGAGLWFTGFLYKNRANISMTGDDAEALQAELDWNHFADTYFASRRLVAAMYWDHPSFAELMRLNVALVAQVDLNEGDRPYHYHSQYLIAKATLPIQGFIFELGGAVEVAQTVSGNGNDFNIGLAGDIALRWMPPAAFHNMLSLTGRFTSGQAESGPMSTFTPITALTYGDVLAAKLPGLSVIGLNYTARLHHTFSTSLNVSHFVRSDLGTFTAWPLDGEANDNFFLGTEIFARFIWSPVSDMSFNLGAGAFLPALGNVAPNANPRWRVKLALTLALY